ncbi:hypothetical protein MKY91_20625 [Alkalicoccobacillus gibsonii]|uniref:Uncharacterized protein n=1 Tax=Alkalicoccobacillus gibsonii TaxID=79881 RepID=A0ABU9VNV7_9BACI
MNFSDRVMLSEIHSLTNAVPNFRNNMDMKGYSSFRSDSLQLQFFLKELTYSMLMTADKTENKRYWVKKFNERLSEAKEFVEHRQKEAWNGETTYRYSISSSGW